MTLVCFIYLCLRVWSPLIYESREVVASERKYNNHRKFPVWNVRTGKAWAIWSMEQQLLPPPSSPQSQDITMHSELSAASALGSTLGFNCKWNLSATADVYQPVWKPGLVLALRKSSARGEAPQWEHSNCWHAVMLDPDLWTHRRPRLGSPCSVCDSGSLSQGEFQRDFESSWTRGRKILGDDTHKSGIWINYWTGKTEFSLRSALSLTWRSSSYLSEGRNTVKCASLF